LYEHLKWYRNIGLTILKLMITNNKLFTVQNISNNYKKTDRLLKRTTLNVFFNVGLA